MPQKSIYVNWVSIPTSILTLSLKINRSYPQSFCEFFIRMTSRYFSEHKSKCTFSVSGNALTLSLRWPHHLIHKSMEWFLGTLVNYADLAYIWQFRYWSLLSSCDNQSKVAIEIKTRLPLFCK